MDVTLSQARDEAREKRRAVRLGLDVGLPPVGQRGALVAAESKSVAHSFEAVALEFFESQSSA